MVSGSSRACNETAGSVVSGQLGVHHRHCSDTGRVNALTLTARSKIGSGRGACCCCCSAEAAAVRGSVRAAFGNGSRALLRPDEADDTATLLGLRRRVGMQKATEQPLTDGPPESGVK